MKALLRKIRQILKDRRTRQMLTRIISVTAAIVVFVTTYALVLPAITMEAEAQCGLEAHQHDDSCFEEVLSCDIPESPGHTHTDACYTTSSVLTCEIEEHEHSVENGCYDENGNLICGKAEHVHSEENGCYSEERTLVCGLEESEGHTHDSSCYEKVLTCGKEVHTHSTACYKSDAASIAATESAAVASTESAAAAAAGNVEIGENQVPLTDGVSGEASAWASTGIAASTGATAVADSNGYVPVLEELDFHTLLNTNTGIYYSRPVVPADGTDGSTDGNGVDTGGVDTETTDNVDMEPTWNRIDNSTTLTESDTLRLYLAYTIPAGSLNSTNPTARYRLPSNITLTDAQVEQINGTVNGIANQYVNMDTLEILDEQMYKASLGIEAVEGNRTPDQDVQDYLKSLEKAGKDAAEYISATVKVENVYDEVSGKYLGQDLVFCFTQYTVEKNQHEYDAGGQPTKAGEELSGWVAIDVTTDQIDWISTGDEENIEDQKQTAEIVFVEKDRELGLRKISAELKLAVHTDESETDEAGVDTTADEPNADMDDGIEDGREAATEDIQQDGGEDASSGDAEEDQSNYPAISFDDSITVIAGTLSTDTDAVETMDDHAEITVHVEADENTFPEATTMVLSAVDDEQMNTVAEAVEGAVDAPKTNGFHAVDISFRDSKGVEIEPLKPIRVSMTSDAIKRAVEDKSTAPVVVHLSDPADQATAGLDAVDAYADGGDEAADGEPETSTYAVVDKGAGDTDEDTRNEQDHASDEDMSTPTASVIEAATVAADGAVRNDEDFTDTLIFTAGEFSIYAIVYTVDFHWTVDGEEYVYRITGGSAISLSELLPILGIVKDDENTEVNEVKAFMEDVESVTFSDPELAWIEKVVEDTTFGEIEDRRELEIQYSADVDDAAKEEYRNKTVSAGDWALISVRAFQSEEVLAVTMKNGDEWTVKVTDASRQTNNLEALNDVLSNDSNARFLIYSTSGSTNRYLKNDGTTTTDPPTTSTIDNYSWRIWKSGSSYYIQSVRNNYYLNLNSTGTNASNLYSNSYQAVTLAENDKRISIYRGNNRVGYAGSPNNKFYVRNDGDAAKLNFLYIDTSSSSTSDVPSIELTNDQKEQMEKWKQTIDAWNTLTDYSKTAEVFNYDKRIYKIDLAADSGITDFYKDVDLGFVLDVSNSMNFPSSLAALKSGNSDYQIRLTPSNLDTARSRYSTYYNKENCFYIISDPSVTSTIYKVFKESDGWKYQDASSSSNTKYPISDSTVLPKDAIIQNYTLYYADDTKKRWRFCSLGG